MALLEVDDIHVFYGNIEALSGLSIQVDAGEMVAILGSNGAGKTTTLRTISGLNRAREGTVRFDGRDITRVPAHEIVALGLCQVPEGRRIFSTLTVAENLSLGGYLMRNHPQELREHRENVLKTFPRLGERRNQLAGTLSGGEQQMLAIGRGLMARPRLLLLDEPSLGLAPPLVERIFAILRDLRGAGISVLIAEQNARMTLAVADRGYVLENGSIVAHGSGSELLHSPQIVERYLGIGTSTADVNAEPATAALTQRLRAILAPA
jgi:branched-chain amino acid transport system ATP-binding protein